MNNTVTAMERLRHQVEKAEGEYLQAAKDIEKVIFRRNKAQFKFTTLRDAYEKIKSNHRSP